MLQVFICDFATDAKENHNDCSECSQVLLCSKHQRAGQELVLPFDKE